jgi:glycerophosphoryl diester phosphodiesterase
MSPTFDLQGHRGARGLKPENTLPAFEAAFDVGVTSVETDVHLTHDGVPILFHDAVVSDRHCRLPAGHAAPDPAGQLLVSSLTLAEMRAYRADRNPDPRRFPDQDPSLTPLAELFATKQGMDPYAPPSLADLFGLAQEYAGELGRRAGKSEEQRIRAGSARFELDLKRVPFRPETIGDGFDGTGPRLFESRILETARAAGVLGRVAVRCFDHRCILYMRRLEPSLEAAVLTADNAPVSLTALVRQAGAVTYCPSYHFLDQAQVRLAHADNIRVVPWTVNEAADWERLLQWGVDGICTDYPDRLAMFLRECGRDV